MSTVLELAQGVGAGAAGVGTTLAVQWFRRRRTYAEASKLEAAAEAQVSKAKSEAQKALDDRFERLSASMERRLENAEQEMNRCEQDRTLLREAVLDMIVACDERTSPTQRHRAIESARSAIGGMHAGGARAPDLHPPS